MSKLKKFPRLSENLFKLIDKKVSMKIVGGYGSSSCSTGCSGTSGQTGWSGTADNFSDCSDCSWD